MKYNKYTGIFEIYDKNNLIVPKSSDLRVINSDFYITYKIKDSIYKVLVNHKHIIMNKRLTWKYIIDDVNNIILQGNIYNGKPIMYRPLLMYINECNTCIANIIDIDIDFNIFNNKVFINLFGKYNIDLIAKNFKIVDCSGKFVYTFKCADNKYTIIGNIKDEYNILIDSIFYKYIVKDNHVFVAILDKSDYEIKTNIIKENKFKYIGSPYSKFFANNDKLAKSNALSYFTRINIGKTLSIYNDKSIIIGKIIGYNEHTNDILLLINLEKCDIDVIKKDKYEYNKFSIHYLKDDIYNVELNKKLSFEYNYIYRLPFKHISNSLFITD